MKLAQNVHLTYCSNIHPGETWAEVFRNLQIYLPAVREQLLPSNEPFAIGLRLSARAAQTLEQEANMEVFQDFLSTHNSYVFTINGFPYGVFHRARVKEKVYLPDWKDVARLAYTNRLARILAQLLPEDPEIEGSISTVPGAFQQEICSTEDVHLMGKLMLQSAAFLHRLRSETGKTVTLALEPEPCCYLETIEDLVTFFQDYLFSREGLRILAEELCLTSSQAEVVARRHLGICCDTCHMAVEFEDLVSALDLLERTGIRILKIQISSALKICFQEGDGKVEQALRPFAEGTYLHQVVEQSQKGVARYLDLPQALNQEARVRNLTSPPRNKEWRVHFHLPVFLEKMKDFDTTQDYLSAFLQRLKSNPVCDYLEVETYTWDVIPENYKTLDTASAIARELAWVRDRILE